MTRFVLFLIFACISLGGNAWADEVKEGCVTVQRSDNLTRVARALNSTVSNLVVVNGIKDQDRIYPGQKICRDADVKNPAMDSEPLQQKKPAKPNAPKNSETDIAETKGYTPYAETGRNPLVSKNEQNPKILTQIEKDALRHIGVGEQDISRIEQSLSEGKAESVSLLPGTKFVSMSERGKGKGAVKITRNRIATWKDPEHATIVTLSDGRKIARIDSCSNWTQVEVEPQLESIAIAAVTPEPEEVPKEEGVELCGPDDHDAFLSRGRTDGNGSKTGWKYASGSVCLAKTRVDGGTAQGGIGGLYGDHQGHATTDGFQYSGKRYGWGPDAKYIDDDGWDVRLGGRFGKSSNNGRSADGDYAQTRNFNLRGVDFGINLYQRELAGEKWFPKTQIYGSYFKLSARDLHHSWQGNQIADTSDLKSSSLFSIGVRQFIYQGAVKPWISLEYFAEFPSTRNLTGMVGVTDEDEILWAGIGLTRNLEKGGVARSWMVGVDVGNGIRKLRSDARHEEWESANTSYYDEDTGAFTVKRPETSGDTSSSSIARFDIASGKFVKQGVSLESKPTTLIPKEAQPDTPVAAIAPASEAQHPSVLLSQEPVAEDRWATAGWGNK